MMLLEGLHELEQFDDTIGTRNSDLPACRTASQPTTRESKTFNKLTSCYLRLTVYKKYSYVALTFRSIFYIL
jgi:hypothetical protein